jgi:tetratricopeptide (TPR) repeat protein
MRPGTRRRARSLLAVALLARALLLGAFLLGVAACRTVPPDQVAQPGGVPEITALDAFDARLLELRLAPDPSALAGVRADLDTAATQAGLSRQMRARADALRAEAALMAGDATTARQRLADAAALSDGEEGVWLVRALLETDPVKRLAVLEQGIVKAGTSSRLLCERGEALLAAGRYAEAAKDFDEGLRGLAPGYEKLYGPDRDKAFALAQAVRDAGSAPLRSEGLEGPVTIRALVERTASDTRLLAGLSPDPKTSFAALLPSLSSAGLLLDPSAPADAPAARKAVAYFLWGLVARAEHDPRLLTKYRQKYTVSPVPDIAAGDPWFDAVLGMVEREIMDLPDGVRFMPDGPVTGFELVAMLAKLKKLEP